jgi:hypothetical protein
MAASSEEAKTRTGSRGDTERKALTRLGAGDIFATGSRENLGGVRGAVLAEMSLVTLDDITVKLLKLGR